MVRPQQSQPCRPGRCCDRRPELPSAFSRAKKEFVKKLTPKPTLRLGDMGLDQLHCLDDCALIDYAITAAAALAAADDDDDDGEVAVEAVCPSGARPGDTLEVRTTERRLPTCRLACIDTLVVLRLLSSSSLFPHPPLGSATEWRQCAHDSARWSIAGRGFRHLPRAIEASSPEEVAVVHTREPEPP